MASPKRRPAAAMLMRTVILTTVNDSFWEIENLPETQ